MENSLTDEVQTELQALPEILLDGALRFLERMADANPDLAACPDLVRSLLRLAAVSEFAANMAVREADWLLAGGAALSELPARRELEEFAERIAASEAGADDVQQQLRQYRNRYMFRIAWAATAGVSRVEDELEALSALADLLLAAAAGYVAKRMRERFGVVRDPRGGEVPIVILGMGKLGGYELNFSSDIDIIFLYPGGADSDGDRELSAVEYFTRMSRQIVALLDEVTSDGFVFRIDTRLRPFGDSGPPVVSFAALESYLLQHGRGWERYAYVKARVVGPRLSDDVHRELGDELIRPFVYRRYLDFGVFESLREMKNLIAAEVRRRELADNIKLGPGGIREIEFIVQSLQLVRGGARTDLQGQSLLKVLPHLVGRHGLQAAEAVALLDAYRFLRRAENFIQAMRDRQVHELPANEIDRARLCVAMRYPDWASFVAELDQHRRTVSDQFDRVAFRGREEVTDGDLRDRLVALWDRAADASEWYASLEAEGFADAGEVAAAIARFAGARATQRIDNVARQRLRQFVPDLLLRLQHGLNSPAALNRALAIAEQVLRRSAYLALLNENSHALQRLVSLCEKSAYIAEQIARYPLLLDELLDPRIYTSRISRSDMESELAERLVAAPDTDSEAQMELLAQFQRASQFRVAVADFNGNLPIMRVSDCLTDLAEVILDHALKVAWGDMVERHGVPCFEIDGELRQAGFGIVAYGKFGGIELSYGSDLDLVFLHDSRGANQVTNGTAALDNTMFFTRLVRRLVHFLTTQTGSGQLYEIDTRLRPDGHSGLLVTSVESYERYQEENAWTWEHQALLRARPVAGSSFLAREFERVRAETLMHRVHRETLCEDVVSMRRRMRENLDKGDTQVFDLKQGAGGIADIEFIVQYLVLLNAREHPAVIHYPDNIRQLATLAASGCLRVEAALKLQDIYRAYRLRLHHLSLDDRPPLVGKDDFAAERTAVRGYWQTLLGGPAA
jgi:glutamate-ammonia-ligase adenylyltransferase